jgi:uncharacterized cupredoxin-like copper-binding protein
MSTRHPVMVLEHRLTRRSAVRGVLVTSLGASIAGLGLHSTTAQDVSYPELMITAVDYAFEMPASIEGGHVQITMDNQGEHDHHAMFMRVNEGSTLEELQSALQQPGFDAIFAAATPVGGPNAGPGHSSTVIANLQPGQYLVICAIPNEEGVPHYALGMQSPLEVTEPAASATDPEADATVALVDMAFEGLPSEVAAGSHIWEVQNLGPSLHEIAINRLQEGVTFEMVQAMMSEAPPEATPVDVAQASPQASPVMSGPPPFETVTGTAPMNPENTNWLVLDLEAGEYFAICFVPDFATGVPHFALGMMAPFTVT